MIPPSIDGSGTPSAHEAFGDVGAVEQGHDRRAVLCRADERRADLTQRVALDRHDDELAVRDERAVIGHLWAYCERFVGPHRSHLEAALPHRGQMRSAGHQANLMTRAAQRSGVVAPDTARADDAEVQEERGAGCGGGVRGLAATAGLFATSW